MCGLSMFRLVGGFFSFPPHSPAWLCREKITRILYKSVWADH